MIHEIQRTNLEVLSQKWQMFSCFGLEMLNLKQVPLNQNSAEAFHVAPEAVTTTTNEGKLHPRCWTNGDSIESKVMCFCMENNPIPVQRYLQPIEREKNSKTTFLRFSVVETDLSLEGTDLAWRSRMAINRK